MMESLGPGNYILQLCDKNRKESINPVFDRLGRTHIVVRRPADYGMRVFWLTPQKRVLGARRPDREADVVSRAGGAANVQSGRLARQFSHRRITTGARSSFSVF